MNQTLLKQKILESGLKQDWISKQVGIATNTLSRIVNGKVTPDVKTALKIARVLGTTVEELWGDDAK